MKKKIMYTLLLMIFPFVIYADGIILECPDEVKPNTSFTCELIGSSDSKVTDVDLSVTTSGNVTFLSFTPTTGWQGDGAGGHVTLYSDQDFTGEFAIGTLKYKITEDETNTVTVEQGTFYHNKKQVTLDPVSEIVKVVQEKPATDNKTDNDNNDNKTDDNSNSDSTEVASSVYLIDIVIDNYMIEFDRDTNEYELTINDEKELVIEPILEDYSSTVEIIGNEKLKDGSEISIVVTNTNNDTNTYTIHIIKEAKASDKKYNIIFLIIIGILVIINILRIVGNARKKKVNGENNEKNA